MAITFRFAGQDRTLSSDQAHWLLGQVRTARELTPAAAAVAAKIEQGLEENGVVETTLTEKRELIEALERGSTKPRPHELRTLEIGLHTAVYAETYVGYRNSARTPSARWSRLPLPGDTAGAEYGFFRLTRAPVSKIVTLSMTTMSSGR